MQLNLLLNAISREKPVHFVQMSNPKREIDSTRMLLDSDPVRRTDMLYICDHTYYKKLTSGGMAASWCWGQSQRTWSAIRRMT